MAQRGIRRHLDHRLRQQDDVLPQHAVDGASLAVVPVLLRAIQVRGVEGADNGVTYSQLLGDGATDLDDLARGVGAGDDLVLDGEGVLGGGDGEVAVVERDGADADEDFAVADGGNVFLEALELVE